VRTGKAWLQQNVSDPENLLDLIGGFVGPQKIASQRFANQLWYRAGEHQKG